MASSSTVSQILLVLAVAMSCFIQVSLVHSRKLTALVDPSSTNPPLKYHNGAVLHGRIPISIIWYGKFSAPQKSILSDFIVSLSITPKTKTNTPSVNQWWNTIHSLYTSKALKLAKNDDNTRVLLSSQVTDENCTLGKSLKRSQIAILAAKAEPEKGGVAVVLTADDVAVEGFCMSSCGFHSSNVKVGYTYIWVGNPAKQCPGQCAWPFYKPIYGPQTPPLIPPNGDVGADGMVINLAAMMAGTVTNPFGDGFYQGSKDAPLEAASACPGVYGKNAYPGYAGDLLADEVTGASYNANGSNGRKYLLPALFDPQTSACSTLV